MSDGCWFPCYVNDLFGSMRWKRMSPAQRGAYWQLICWQMQSEDGHLDTEVSTLSALSDLDLSNGNAIVVEAFPVMENGRRANVRALREWHKRRALSDVRSKVGSDGIRKRWQGHSKCHSKPIANAATTTTTSTSIPTATVTTTEKIPPLPPKGGCAPCALTDFDEFWKAYPRKIGKKAAARAWKQAKDRPPLSEIVAAVEAQKRGDQWTRDGGQYIPHPSTWLTRGSWSDEVRNTHDLGTGGL